MYFKNKNQVHKLKFVYITTMAKLIQTSSNIYKCLLLGVCKQTMLDSNFLYEISDMILIGCLSDFIKNGRPHLN